MKKFKILDKEDEGIRDSMTFLIKKSLIWKEIELFIEEIKPEFIISFDGHGVSGHTNHIQIFETIKKYRENKLIKNL